MNILDCLFSRGIKPQRVSAHWGGEYHSECPGCGGKDRFISWPNHVKEGGWWMCRQCGRKGDVIQFFRAFENLGFVEACKRAGQPVPHSSFRALPSVGPKDSPENFNGSPRELPGEKWRGKAAELMEKAFAELQVNAKVQTWLERRGVTVGRIVQHKLGWLPGENNKGCMYRARSAWGLPDRELKSEGGGVRVQTKLWIPRGILIPTLSGGAAVSLRVRRPAADLEATGAKDKYHVVSGAPALPFVALPGLEVFAVKYWVVVETQLDAVMLADQAETAGLSVGVISLLSALGKPCPATHKLLAGAVKILAAHDNDEAGVKGAKWMLAAYPNCQRWPVPQGKDLGDYFKRGGDIAAWLREGIEYRR